MVGYPLAHPHWFLCRFWPLRFLPQARCVYQWQILSAPPRCASWRDDPDIHFPDTAVLQWSILHAVATARVLEAWYCEVAPIYSDPKATHLKAWPHRLSQGNRANAQWCAF